MVIHKPVPLRPAIELSLEFVELEPPQRLILREEDEASVFEVEYRLERTRSGTRFTQISEFEWKKPRRLLHRFLALGVERDVRNQLKELKRKLEA